ncbi:aldose epimerase family protein [Maritimibacter sp. HL-12]|uniref:aldose epimerase family protein n=1 Tax=Maritimibacter sp. HL-12 TaxID=1162418 RepID=UPI000A0F0EAC|nr:aldose epimerase family protein [Maritimibacter sp. HL-12]SMH44216.1 aldose 1-epimerase [Maritimibacter sp. HL-12]
MIERGHTRIHGRAIDLARLVAGDMEVTLLSFGSITRDWRIAGRPVVLGYPDPADYGDDPFYMGIIAGRVANRIAGGRFPLGPLETELPLNDGANHLHGGPRGLGKRHWQMEADTAAGAVRLSCVSGHGDGGYPGRAAFEVVVSLSETRLTYDMRAEVDRPTPINLAQHNYYNLTGGEIWDHELQIAAQEYLPIDAGSIPLGHRAPVAGTTLDFREARRIGEVDAAREGIDHCMVLTGEQPAAVLTAPGAPTLRFFTDQPGLQLYTGKYLSGAHQPFTGICLEPEGFPDAVNQPGFPSVMVTPDAPYVQRLSIEVG